MSDAGWFGGTLAEKAYLEIRERILRGKLPMGAAMARVSSPRSCG